MGVLKTLHSFPCPIPASSSSENTSYRNWNKNINNCCKGKGSVNLQGVSRALQVWKAIESLEVSVDFQASGRDWQHLLPVAQALSLQVLSHQVNSPPTLLEGHENIF